MYVLMWGGDSFLAPYSYCIRVEEEHIRYFYPDAIRVDDYYYSAARAAEERIPGFDPWERCGGYVARFPMMRGEKI